MAYRPKKGHVKLERALSKLGLASRTEARKLILDGKVKVGGRVLLNPEFLVVPERAEIEIAGVLAKASGPRVIMLHKPRGLVCTKSDEKGRPTVYDVKPALPKTLMPVGRLDLATSGLLLFTNDTRLSDWICDPKNEVEKTYLVTVRGELGPTDLSVMENGIESRGEILRAKSGEILKASGRETLIKVTLTEGKNREIRRMMEVLGHEVTGLKRIKLGSLELGDLALGKWTELSHEQLCQRLGFERPMRKK